MIYLMKETKTMKLKILKRVLAVGVTAVMTLSIMACGRGTSEVVRDETVTDFRIFAGISALSPDNSEKTLIQQMNETMGVHITWENVSEDSLAERKNLIFGAGVDLPDAFMGAGLSDFELITHGASGTLIPLNDYINEANMPNFMRVLEARPNLLSEITMPSGNIYSLPSISEMSFIYKDGNAYSIGSIPQFTAINRVWLDELGLQMPRTIDDLYQVLIAFRDNSGSDDRIPLSFMHGHWAGGMSTLFSAFGFTNYTNRGVIDGQVVFHPAREEYKEAIQYFHNWFNEGLIDMEVFSQDVSQYIAKGNAGRLGVFSWWEIPEVVGELAYQYEYLGFLTDQNGNHGVNLNESVNVSRGSFAITNACRNPELLLRWVDQLFDPLYSMQAVYGPIGEFFTSEPGDDGIFVMRELKEGETEGELKGRLELWGPHAQLAEHFGSVYHMEARAQQRLDDLRDFWFPNVTNFETFPNVTFEIEELDTLNELLEDIDQFVAEQTANWLRNGGIEDEWQDYLERLDRIGLQEVLSIWQTALNRYHSER